ncbi:MAG: pyridoxal-phosphate dependent enzyme [Candidatus Methylomirabilia bacterium]
MLDLSDIHAAQERLRHKVRHTPLVRAAPVRERPWGDAALWLKLECLQITGSFKARGAVNRLLTLDEDEVRRGLITASSGNHGLGVAYAGWLAGVPVTVYLPNTTPHSKAEKLELWEAKVVQKGAVWDEANEAALQNVCAIVSGAGTDGIGD